MASRLINTGSKKMFLKRKIIFEFIIVVLIATIICGCDKVEPKGSNEKSSANTSETTKQKETKTTTKTATTTTTTTDEIKYDPWKTAYIDYINNTLVPKQWSNYKLIYVDGDDIPELVAIGVCEAQGNMICVYHDGVVNATQLSRLGFTYIAKGNLLCNSEGLMDSYYDVIYKIKNGVLTEIASGSYGNEDNTGLKMDDNGDSIYTYEWENKKVTKEEYYKHLNAVYDKSKAIDGYHAYDYYSAKKIISIIQNY